MTTSPFIGTRGSWIATDRITGERFVCIYAELLERGIYIDRDFGMWNKSRAASEARQALLDGAKGVLVRNADKTRKTWKRVGKYRARVEISNIVLTDAAIEFRVEVL